MVYRSNDLTNQWTDADGKIHYIQTDHLIDFPDDEDETDKILTEPGSCEQCHEMLARIDEQRGYSLCSDCRWQKAIEEAD